MKRFILFKALAGETRVKIIELLREKGSLGSKEIADELGVTPAAISQHLKILEHSGILKSQRQGYWIPYSLDEETLQHCMGEVEQLCCGPMHGHHFHRFHWRHKKKNDLKSLEKQKELLRKELEEVERRIEKTKE